MARVVLQPAGSPASHQHYLATVTTPVDLAGCFGLTSSDRAVLQSAFPEGAAQFWGATPAANGANVKKHAKIRPGDLVLFVEKNRVFSRARIRYTFCSQQLAKQLWGTDDKGQTWELMFAIDDVKPIDIPVLEVNLAVGYQPTNVVQGFTVLDDAKSAALLEYLGEFGDDPPTGTASDNMSVPNFKPKDSSEYLATVQAHVQIRRRDHEQLIADFGAAVAKLGFIAATNVHPRDLTLTRDDDHWLVEAKMVYNGDATSAVRAVVGQLLQYAHFLYSNGGHPKLLALFSQCVGEAYVGFLESLGIASIWRESNTWRMSESAAKSGFAMG
jgi:hypothetical protein